MYSQTQRQRSSYLFFLERAAPTRRSQSHDGDADDADTIYLFRCVAGVTPPGPLMDDAVPEEQGILDDDEGKSALAAAERTLNRLVSDQAGGRSTSLPHLNLVRLGRPLHGGPSGTVVPALLSVNSEDMQDFTRAVRERGLEVVPVSARAVPSVLKIPFYRTGFRGVWLPSRVSRALEDIKHDHESGAQQMADNALTTLVLAAEEWLRARQEGDRRAGEQGAHIESDSEAHANNSASVVDLKETLLGVAHHVVAARPSMAASLSYVLSSALDKAGLTVALSEHGGPSTAEEAVERVKEAVREVREEGNVKGERMAEHAIRVILDETRAREGTTSSPPSRRETDGVHIFTTSFSSATLAVLSRLIRLMLPPSASWDPLSESPLPARVHITVSESRPLNEGVRLMDALGKVVRGCRLPSERGEGNADPRSDGRQVSLSLVTDAAICAAILTSPFGERWRTQYDTVVLLGADRILPSGDVVNKVGSLAAAWAGSELLASLGRRGRSIVVSRKDKIWGGRSGDVGGEEGEEAVELEEKAPDELFPSWRANLPESTLTSIITASERASPVSDANADRNRLSSDVVRVRNFYFEVVPARYVSAYVTEEGAGRGTEDVRRWAVERRKLEERVWR